MNYGRIAIITAICGIATPALAQDGPLFGGLYAGALVGYDHVKISDSTGSGSKDGVTYGAVVGYDADLGSTVAGVEAEISDSSTKETLQNLLVVGDVGTLSAGRDLYVGGRFGFKATPRTLIYLKGGYTNARAKLAYTNSVGTTFTDHDNLNGFRLGGGVEYAFDRHLGIRGEYRYSDYGNYHYNGVDTGLKTRRHQVVVTLVGKF
jgi:outer membrane immunogenic protein